MTRPRSLSPEQEAVLCERYRSGDSLAVLAAAYGFSRFGVSKILRRNAISTRANITSLLRHADIPGLPDQPTLYGSGPYVAVANPMTWDVDTIQARFGYERPTHASKHFLKLKEYVSAHNAGLMLLWEDELQKPCLARMLRYRSGNEPRLCSARDADAVMIPKPDADAFYNANHLQGKCNSGCTYGLVYNNAIVAAMSFGHGGTCRGTAAEHTLQRFATAGVVPGAASKLLTAFRRKNAGSILSYSDCRYAGGRLYETLGFRAIGVAAPDYRYFDPQTKRWYAKNQCQRKHLIPRLGRQPTTEETEWDMARAIGLRRCYDLGKITWLLDTP